MSMRTYAFGAPYTYGAGLHRCQVLASAAETVDQVVGGAGPLAHRANPFTAATVAALLWGDTKGCSYLA